jgi:hypothetical protein
VAASQATTTANYASKTSAVKGVDPQLLKMMLKPKRGQSQKRINLVSDDSDDQAVENAESSKRKIRHYSMVQNQPIFFEDLKEFQNKVMLSIDVPRYFHFDLIGPGAKLTQAETEYEKRMKDTVIFVTFSQNIGAQKIAELFNVYGDINVR